MRAAEGQLATAASGQVRGRVAARVARSAPARGEPVAQILGFGWAKGGLVVGARLGDGTLGAVWPCREYARGYGARAALPTRLGSPGRLGRGTGRIAPAGRLWQIALRVGARRRVAGLGGAGRRRERAQGPVEVLLDERVLCGRARVVAGVIVSAGRLARVGRFEAQGSE